jgi:Protein of unknown function (DUF2752)
MSLRLAAAGPLPRLGLHHRLAAPAGALLAGAGALAVLAVRDPHRAGSYGHCPFLALTGHPCPLCGGLRAGSDLTHGDVLAALQSNALAVAILVGGTAIWSAWCVRRWRGTGRERPPLTSDPRLGRVMAVLVLLFAVLRWLPGLTALSPS